MGAFDYGPSGASRRVAYVNKPTATSFDIGVMQGMGSYTSGASTAFTTLLSVSGRGVINFAACVSSGAVSATLGFRITVDGVVIYTGSGNVGVSGVGFIGIGALADPGGLQPVFQPIFFEKSFKIEGLNASNNFTAYVDYEIHL